MPCSCSAWRRWIRPLAALLYVLMLLLLLPLAVWELRRAQVGTHRKAWFIAGVFVSMTIPVSLWGVLQHLVHYTHPDLQNPVIRILMMVPIYSIDSWLSLWWPSAGLYAGCLRELYEALVIYSLLDLLLGHLAHEFPSLTLLLEVQPQQPHLPPLCCLQPWSMGEVLLSRCKLGVLQYTVVRPVTTVIALMCQMFGVYDEGNFSFRNAWSYLVLLNTASQLYALYCVVLLYRVLREELAAIRPLEKILCVVMVTFFTSWQAEFIALLVKVGVVSDTHTWEWHSVESVATGLQDFIVVVEMFLAAIAHHYAFPATPFVQEAHDVSCCDSFLSMWDLSDITADISQQVRSVGRSVLGRQTSSRPVGPTELSEHTGLLAVATETVSAPSSPRGRYQGLGHTPSHSGPTSQSGSAPNLGPAPAGFTSSSWDEDSPSDQSEGCPTDDITASV